MIYINHRINTLEQLKNVPKQNGIELDIRYHEDELILHHNPLNHHKTKSQKFIHLLKEWEHKGPMILNIKTEGIEEICIKLVNEYNVKNWFFLDLSMPYFVNYANWAKQGKIKGLSPKNLAVRFSESEPIEYALSFSSKANWVWVDCFTFLPIEEKVYKQFKKAGFKICLVSPELQNHSMKLINVFLKQCNGLNIDAVCTKRPDLWGQKLSKKTIKQLEQDYPFA